MTISDLFEIIDEIPKDSPSAVEKVREPTLTPIPSHDTGGEHELTWCEFCKGYYIEEYHVERAI